MLTWLWQGLGVCLDALLRRMTFSHHAIGAHDTVDELVSEVVAGHGEEEID